jgi:hypothetical protein
LVILIILIRVITLSYGNDDEIYIQDIYKMEFSPNNVRLLRYLDDFVMVLFHAKFISIFLVLFVIRIMKTIFDFRKRTSEL